MAFLANLFRTSPEEELVNKATDELLISHDWAANLEIADVVNNAADEAVAAEVVRAVRKRLQHRERRVLLLSLELLESLMKNCHEPLHSEEEMASGKELDWPRHLKQPPCYPHSE